MRTELKLAILFFILSGITLVLGIYNLYKYGRVRNTWVIPLFGASLGNLVIGLILLFLSTRPYPGVWNGATFDKKEEDVSDN
jgi:hypothetical protein